LEVDPAVDAVGFEARGHGESADEPPASVLNDIMNVTRDGAALRIPVLYLTGDLCGVCENANTGQSGVRLGLGWAKSHYFTSGQCPVKQYNRQLMTLILADKAHIADAVNATKITLDEAPEAYQKFDAGAAHKYVIDPHNMVA